MSVYCGRARGGKVPRTPLTYGWLGNPIKRGEVCPFCGERHTEPGSTLPCYEVYLMIQVRDPEWRENFIETMQGVPLQELRCFCPDRSKCHTSVMHRVVATLTPP